MSLNAKIVCFQRKAGMKSFSNKNIKTNMSIFHV